jgi:riboflavin kinase
VFDARVSSFTAPPPPEVPARLARIARAAPLLPASPAAAATLLASGGAARVLDVGTGAGALVPHLLAAGATHVLGIDLSEGMLSAAAASHPPPSGAAAPLGNAPGVRFRRADVADLPAHEGPFAAVYFNAVFGNVYDQRDALARAALLLAHGGHVVVSHPLGARYVASLRAEDAAVVPHTLPDAAGWEQMLKGLPLRLVSFVDEPDLYIATLQLPRLYALPEALGAVRLSGRVVRGFGRGSRQMGVPTANLPPEEIDPATLAALPRGVYYAWAALAGEAGPPRKAVLNIGARPTFADGTGDTVRPRARARARVARKCPHRLPTLPTAPFPRSEGAKTRAMPPRNHATHSHTRAHTFRRNVPFLFLPQVEVHVMHDFGREFYGEELRVRVLGFMRPELKFSGIAALVARIRADVGAGAAMLDAEESVAAADDPWLRFE